jgi:hypothetical protein
MMDSKEKPKEELVKREITDTKRHLLCGDALGTLPGCSNYDREANSTSVKRITPFNI